MGSTETNTEAKPTAKCPRCEREAEFKWMINNPFARGLSYPEMYCQNCKIYFTVRKDI
jgi:C4-type Zn-finger protein